MIRIAAAVVVDGEGRILLVRKRGTAAFMLPGGKVGSDETAVAALARELAEELGCVILGDHRPLGRFSAPAANEPDTIVEADLFAVALAGEIAPAAEIEEVLWHHPDEAPAFAFAPLARDHVLPLVRAWNQQ